MNARGRMPSVTLPLRDDAPPDRRRPHRAAFDGERSLAAVHAFEFRFQQVHLRRADEAGDEDVGRLGEHLVRRGHLLDHAVAHDRDAIGHGQRFELIVRDDDGRLGEAGQHALDLAAHGLAQFDVEAGQRLVEQEAVGVAHDRAGHRDALLLPFGDLAGQPVEHALQMQEVGDLGDPRRAAAGASRSQCSGNMMFSRTVSAG